MLARFLLLLSAVVVPAEAADLAITAVVVKRVQLSVQGDRLEVRSNNREGVMLSIGDTRVVVPAGVHVVRLPPGAPRITAFPL